jgi:arginase family enzyme
MRASADALHVVYVDGDFDDAAPDPARCQSAAALAVWLVTQGRPFRAGPPLSPSQVSVVGWSTPSLTPQAGMRSVSLADVRGAGPREAAQRTLDTIPASAPILLHLDVDVFRKRDVPATYFPHTDGLSLSEGAELLGPLLGDPRVRIVEVSEYAALRDGDQACVNTLVDLLVEGLAR